MFVPASSDADSVLRAFYRDAPALFLGAAFVAAGLVAIAFALLRQRRDRLLIYFGVFAALYGVRLWAQSRLLSLTFPHSLAYVTLRTAINYVVPLPFILYLRSAGLLSGAGRVAGYALVVVDSVLAIVTIVFGPRHTYDIANNVAVILALVVLIVQFLRDANRDEDLAFIRWGLLVFAGFALWDNAAGFYAQTWRVEPLGFAFFLACLGYVAARRTLRRDEQLSEIRQELDVARRIQLSILPAQFPPSPHFKVAARYIPMTSVAGDLYEYVVAGQNEAGLLIADVSGHGVPAALIASMVKLAAASQREVASDPAEFLVGMNRVLHGNTQTQFVTAAYVYVDASAGTLRYSAAAHPPMLLLRNGEVREIEENGLMLAAFDFATYSNVSHAIRSGDRLLLYTDGIIEASNDAGEFYGREALMQRLKETAEHTPDEGVKHIISSVQQWSATQQDDLTVLICDCCGLNDDPG